MSPEVGRILLVVGVVIAVVGLLTMFGVRLPLGRLPGDISISGEHGGIYLPLATMLLISLLLTVIVNLLGRG